MIPTSGSAAPAAGWRQTSLQPQGAFRTGHQTFDRWLAARPDGPRRLLDRAVAVQLHTRSTLIALRSSIGRPARHGASRSSAAEQEPDSRLRLRRLFDRVVNGTDRAVELRLLASTDDPAVSTALATVTERRIGFVTECFAALGVEGDAARQHAVLAYTSFLGLMQTEHISGGHLFDKLDRNSYLGFVQERLAIP